MCMKTVGDSATSSQQPLIFSTVFSVFPGSAEFLCSTYIVLGYSVLKDYVGPAAWEAAYKRRPIPLVRERAPAEQAQPARQYSPYPSPLFFPTKTT
jgi:hypothetical protein